jgi:hypothetical protein
MPVSPLAWTLPPDLLAQYVFRAATFSIVMMLALGQPIALLCSNWCQPQAIAADECGRHPAPDAAPGLTASDECEGMPVGGAAILPDNVRRTAATLPQNALITAPHQLALAASGAVPSHDGLSGRSHPRGALSPLRL